MLKVNLSYLVRLQSKSDVQSFMGLINCMGKFVHNFSTAVVPISSMMSKQSVYVWGPDQEKEYLVIKAEIKNKGCFITLTSVRKRL